MNNGLKNILVFGGGAALLYWLFSKAGSTPPTVNSGVAEVIDTTQQQNINNKGNIEIDKTGTVNNGGKKGVSYQVLVYNPETQSLEYLQGSNDTVYHGDTPYINTLKDNNGNPVNVYFAPSATDTTIFSITAVLKDGTTYEVVFDWDGNYLNDSQIG